MTTTPGEPPESRAQARAREAAEEFAGRVRRVAGQLSDDRDNLVGQTIAPNATPRIERIPYEEQTRRALLRVFGVMWLVLLALQIWMGMTLKPVQYQAVGAVLGGATTLVTGALGAAAYYYWTNKRD